LGVRLGSRLGADWGSNRKPINSRSHYVIREGRVIEAPQWTKDEIEAGRKRDKEARAKYLANGTSVAAASAPVQKPLEPNWIDRWTAWFKSTFEKPGK